MTSRERRCKAAFPAHGPNDVKCNETDVINASVGDATKVGSEYMKRFFHIRVELVRAYKTRNVELQQCLAAQRINWPGSISGLVKTHEQVQANPYASQVATS